MHLNEGIEGADFSRGFACIAVITRTIVYQEQVCEWQAWFLIDNSICACQCVPLRHENTVCVERARLCV